jgi:hypothetical protein
MRLLLVIDGRERARELRRMRVLVLAVGLGALVASGEPAEVVDGEPVRYWVTAEKDGDVFLVERHEDGWHEAGRSFSEPYETKELTFISDPKGKISSSIRAVRPSYRGREGWQSLRWGMSRAEVLKASKGKTVAPNKAVMEGLAWLTTVADRPARVGCFFANDRLVFLSIVIDDVGDADLLSKMLRSKYGDAPEETETGWLRWSTSETTVRAKVTPLHVGQILYTSKVFALEAADALQKLQDAQAQDL